MITVTDTVSIIYLGAPVGKPRMTRRDKWAKRTVVENYHDFKDAFRLAAYQAGYREQGARVQEIHARAYLALPKSWPKKQKAASMGRPHTSKPDADNILKAVADTLTTDDAGIWNVSLQKYWDDGCGERLEVEVVVAYDM